MSFFEQFGNQLVIVATVVGAVAALPTLIEFWVDRRKRLERVSLSLEDEAVADLDVRLAGLDGFLAANADIIDAVREPATYRTVGNEILVLGGAMTGKKSLAQRIAKDAHMDRLLTVHSPRHPDVLSAAKHLLASYRRLKVLLLLPNLDRVFDDDDPELLSELDALIDHATARANVLVVGTATRFAPDSELDHRFGVKLVLPGTPTRAATARTLPSDARELLTAVTEYYLDRALQAGCVLGDIDRESLVQRVLAVAGNPANVEDILQLCRITALYRMRSGASARAEITADAVGHAIARVIVPGVAGETWA